MSRSRVQSLLASQAKSVLPDAHGPAAGASGPALPDLIDSPGLIRDPLTLGRGLFDDLAAPDSAMRSDGATAGYDAPVENGSGDTTVAVAASGIQGIDGLLAGTRWADGFITYSFPNSTADYQAGYPEALSNFGMVNADQQRAAHFALNQATYTQPAAASGFAVEAFTNLGIDWNATDSAGTIRLANTSNPGTAYAYYPNNGVTGGDAFFGGSGRTPVMGNYHWHTVLHELGHSLGLKHGQEAGGFGAMPAYLDAMEYTVMTYRSYVGGPTTGYTNEQFGYAQTYMMYDIAALQYMYGADFTSNAGATVYKWDPGSGNTLINGSAAITPGANRIFMTIWDGGGIDTYDLSSYTTGVTVNLAPGSSSLLSSTQQAFLGGGNYARGNVYNALLFNGDTRSLIENATGGSGGDTLYGNAANNVLTGNAGNDYMWTSTGDDSLYGGDGNDTLYGAEGNDYNLGGSGDDYIWAYTGNDWLYGQGGVDSLYGGEGNDYLNGSDGTEVDAVLDGGAGSDTLSVSSLTVGHVFDFELGETRTGAGTVIGSLAGIEVFYAGSGDDVVISDGNSNSYYGMAGNDTMIAELGGETLDGGSGVDLLDTTRWSGAYVLNLTTGSSNYGGELYLNFENAVLGAGSDSLFGTAGTNVLDGGAGNDTLDGGDGTDTLIGGFGNDVIYGGLDRDQMLMEDGDDIFYDDAEIGPSGNDTVSGGDGNDTIVGAGGADGLFGDAGDDSIGGGVGNDTLGAGTGTDTLIGGDGDDFYLINGGDTVIELPGGGTDTVLSTASYTLAANVERLVLGGLGNTAGIGNGLANRIQGNAGQNWLSGNGGADTMIGGGGNDTFVTDGLDLIVEGIGGGVDTVRTTTTLWLGANLENLMLMGGLNIAGIGNGLANTITGNIGQNTLNGGLGNDTVFGAAGNDTLAGQDGFDRLDGGLGNDVLLGGLGSDTLVFRSGADRIVDFSNNVDTVALDDALWGGGPRTVAQILAMAAEVAGDVLFNFGGGNTLLLENVGNKFVLADDLMIV
ncbi:M10 family metallopeptidase [Paracoccus luteus]|uniref:M10 family metallopeptidase n=1 Tax=Paracoccus luteus TaxID=2508543 RepID=UPI00106FCC8F|nr:M10 family metallopeptidase C-terminal domain-containing protein [Paracoccus luteus]